MLYEVITHPGFRIVLANVPERRFFSDLVESLQEASKAEVPHQRFVHDHVGAAQVEIATQGKRPGIV